MKTFKHWITYTGTGEDSRLYWPALAALLGSAGALFAAAVR